MPQGFALGDKKKKIFLTSVRNDSSVRSAGRAAHLDSSAFRISSRLTTRCERTNVLDARSTMHYAGFRMARGEEGKEMVEEEIASG
jgi:hypothetical protein